MNSKKVSNYFKNELTNYSCYSTLRMISSAIDGLKNSSRKIMYTALDKLKQETKVSVFDNMTQSYTQYLHGTCSGVIQNLAASYCGSNNLPLLKGEGNFGSRFVNEPAAPRYVYVKNQPYINELFDIRDVLVEQVFEGERIEPKFFVPSLPLILVNGAMNGLASGFKQHILPRNLDDIIDYISGKQVKLRPYIRGFSGVIEDLNVETESGNKQFLISGVVKIKDKTVEILEIPPFIEYSRFLEVLETLLENKTIKSYKDNSDQKNQIYNFTVTMFDEPTDNILDTLKLTKKETEIYNALDEHNKVRTFKSAEDILNYFIDVRKRYMNLQRDFLVEKTKLELNISNNKYRFISMIIENKLQIMKRNRGDIESDLIKLNFDRVDNKFDYLLSLQVHSFTNETLEKLKTETETLNKKLTYLTELDTFKEYLKYIQRFKSIGVYK